MKKQVGRPKNELRSNHYQLIVYLNEQTNDNLYKLSNELGLTKSHLCRLSLQYIQSILKNEKNDSLNEQIESLKNKLSV